MRQCLTSGRLDCGSSTLPRHKITRPADWLMREADAAMGVVHYWLRDPIVEQGSMNGRFASVLDRKRIGRSRGWTGAALPMGSLVAADREARRKQRIRRSLAR